MAKKTSIHSATRKSRSSSTEGELVIPAVEETIDVGTVVHETGKVRVTKTSTAEIKEVTAPETREEYEIKHVPINRPIDAPVQVREEKNVIIIPVVEEVAVITKQLVLREEIHLVRHVEKAQKRQTVTLKKDQVKVEKTRQK